VSLIHIAKYIDNKSIDVNKSNNVADLRGIGEATWKFISFIYNLDWDLLLTDEKSNFFRQKVVFKFTSKNNPIKTEKKGEKSTNKPVSIERLSLLILAKSPKKVKEISKYFKTTEQALNNKAERNSYTQASKPTTIIREVLKIKEAFLNL